MSDLVVVPTPLRKSRAERRLCDAQGGTLLGPRVVTLPQLVPGLLAAASDSRTLLSPLADRLLALDTAQATGLVDAAALRGGAGRAAVRLLADLREGEVSPGDLRAAATGDVAPRTADRLLAAARALDAYEARLETAGALDAAGALRSAATAAARGAVSEETADLGLLVLEGHLPSSRAALDLGAALAARARRVLARIPYLPDEPDASAPAVPWLRRIETLHGGAAQGDVEITFPTAGRLPRGRALRLPAPTDDGQCEAAARFAGSLLDEGTMPDDVAVLAPRRLLEPLRDAFARAGVPLAVTVSRPLSSLPPVHDLRVALSAANGIDRAAALTLLGSAYLAGPEPVPHLRTLLDRAGVLDGRGDPEARLRARADALAAGAGTGRERAGLRRAAAALRDLRELLATLSGSDTPSGWAIRLRAFVDRSGMRRRAAAGDAPLSRRDVSALARAEEAADELAAALGAVGRGAERVEPAGWAALLDLALDRVPFPSGRGPPACAVEAWPLEESPGLDVQAAIVLGADPGAFPAAPPVDPLLGNAGREALCRHLGRRAVPTQFHDRAEAGFHALSALAAGRERVAVSWTSSGEADGPAPLAARVLDRAAADTRRLSGDPSLADARTGAEALRAAGRLAAAGRATEALAALSSDPPLADRVADAALRGSIESRRREGWLRGTWSGEVAGPGLAAWQAGLPDEWSPTDLERFAACPFRLLLRLGGVGEVETGAIDMAPQDEGALVHAVLEAVVREARDRGAWPPVDVPAARAAARAAAEPVLARFESQGRVGDPAGWSARREAILRRLDRFVAAESRGDPALRPVLLEYAFGGRSGRPPIRIPAGDRDVLLAGRIDRVDADAGRLLVLDYKNARDSRRVKEMLAPGALGTASFQVPVYLLAAAGEIPGRPRLEASFALLRSGERVGPWSVEPGDPFLALDEDRRAAIRAAGGRTLADGVVEAVTRIRAGEMPPRPGDCSGCPYGAACRFPDPGDA